MHTYVRVQTGVSTHYGLCDGELITLLSAAPWEGGKVTGTTAPLAASRLLAPVQPSKIVCVGLNYHAHVAASYSADSAPEQPLIFLKPPSAIANPGEPVIMPKQSERVDYEAELGVVIGKKMKGVGREQTMDSVFGYTCVNDVTARDLQKKDGQWTRGKGFDSFCPVGPWIVPASGLDPSNLLVEGILNCDVTQSGRTSQMIFPIPVLLEYICSIMTLLPGDLVVTGTPSNIGPMKPGDTVHVRIEGVGILSNPVASS